MSGNPVVARAGALQAADRFEESKGVLAPHLAEEPDDAWAWQLLAVAHERLGEYELAERAATEMLRISPGHVGALILLSRVLLRLGRPSEARAAAEEAVRRAPDKWSAHFALSGVLVAYATAPPADHERAYEAAHEAVRLAPHEPDAHQALCFTAVRTQRQDVAKQALVEWLRLDPSNETAQAMYTDAMANTPDVTAARAAEMYSAGLAGAPQSPMLRSGLDHATYRLLRGTRWLALVCLAAAGTMIDLFATAKDPTLRELPVPLGNRLWVLMVMAAIWGFGALLRYHRLRTGVQLNIRSLVRRGRWARIVLGQAAWTMLCALLISQIPWTDRSVPEVLFWAGLMASFSTMAYDRRKTG
ncbi:tetratricopeptide repeat protein [Streptomyces sp. NBC_00091]|uniref:tetratricopeptide repeat protein n=1 Tax=Streptomyces sp. NBC_00091 TaxID=2975648 RepID=UPI0022594E6A|nr:tetratricopeptide repeat protein [Streptomyces sp. NBC_00091]MCX5380298.1 tetratricopeptide repeat protein [Streptomyces sp. NBC_00091]